MESLAADDPRQVGPYQLSGRLGAGGMGRVYLGVSPAGRAVALKVVRPELARDQEFVRRFRREVAAAKAVSGAFTAAVIAADPDADPPWLATAFVPGPSLADAVASAGPLSSEAAWRLAGGLAEALHSVHASGLIHRDLKPANVLLGIDGPRVIDFGISRALEGTAITAASALLGTPAYMSPEQVNGLPAGPPSDVFALGSVIAFAVTGSAPFGTGQPLAISYRVVHLHPDLGAIPSGLRELVAACLEKDPASRPSLQQLLESITSKLAAYPAPAPGFFWPLQLHSVIGSHYDGHDSVTSQPPAGAAGESTQTRSRASSAVAHVPLAESETPPRAGIASRASRRKRRRPVIIGAALVILAGGALGVAYKAFNGIANAHSPKNERAPSQPVNVVAVASGQYTIKVSWKERSRTVTDFHIDNGCPVGSCPPGATLTSTAKRATSVSFPVTPGAYDCFRVQALNGVAASPWSSYGCASTPGFAVHGNQVWPDTSVYLTAGEALKITASGTVRISRQVSIGPGGEPSCLPSRSYPNASPPYLAPGLPCYSLIARIGDARPFEVGTSTIVVSTSGYLHLSVNGNEFAAYSGNWTADIKIGG